MRTLKARLAELEGGRGHRTAAHRSPGRCRNEVTDTLAELAARAEALAAGVEEQSE